MVIAEESRAARERAKAEQEVRDAQWRRSFRIHAVILTERRIPEQITFCGLTGGVEVWLLIPFDLSRPAVTFVNQAIAGLERKAPVGESRQRYVPFFGKPTGLVVNYSPDLALRCDLEGNPVEWLSGTGSTVNNELTA